MPAAGLREAPAPDAPAAPADPEPGSDDTDADTGPFDAHAGADSHDNDHHGLAAGETDHHGLAAEETVGTSQIGDTEVVGRCKYVKYDGRNNNITIE